MKAYYEHLEQNIGISFEAIEPILKLDNKLVINRFEDKEVNTSDYYFICTPETIEVYKFNN
jgi:hypothetical protein